MRNIIRILNIIILILFIYSCKEEKNGPPIITIQPATNIQSFSATINCIVNANGFSTSAYFEWGSTTDYEKGIVPVNNPITGTSDVIVSVNISSLRSSTTYHYRLKATNAVDVSFSSDMTFTTATSTPEISTSEVCSRTDISASSGGNVSHDGGATVLVRGVCLSTSPNPTIANNNIPDGSGIGGFAINITGLTANTLYYLRAYATNSIGTAYGNEVIFSTYGTVTDNEGNSYNTIKISTQVWMAENLKATRYQNGDLIGTTSPATLDVSGESQSKYQWAYDGNESNVAIYGRLYTRYAAADSRKICPVGWHIPNFTEWQTLITYLSSILNGRAYVGESMASTSGWTQGNLGSHQEDNNSSGFSAFPSGLRDAEGPFRTIGTYSFWYINNPPSMVMILDYNGNLNEGNLLLNQKTSYSVRCIKDN